MADFVMSCDDGCASDVRVAELAKKYNIETTFYIPVFWKSLAKTKGYEPLSTEQFFELAKDFDIGSHTLTHSYLTQIPLDEAKLEIYLSQDVLESMIDKKVTKFCPPRGYTNKELTEWTLRFYESQRLTRGDGLVHVHPNSGANNNIPWQEYYFSEKAKGVPIEIWGHSHEWDMFDMWEEVEEFLKNESH